ncbi:MAG: hypothetical protein JNL82_20085 [Myxococcales bacterium]|nr:hypothetical protein [Myxococcales bacterium]
MNFLIFNRWPPAHGSVPAPQDMCATSPQAAPMPRDRPVPQDMCAVPQDMCATSPQAAPAPRDRPAPQDRRSRPVLGASLAALVAVACAPDDADAPALPRPQAAPVCPGDSLTFVQRALPVLQGRRPRGVREVRLLADIVDQLDALGADGRALVARGLARGPLYERRWTHFLVDHLGVLRSGDRHAPSCWGPRTLDAPAELAAHVRDHGPEDMSRWTGWTMSDLLSGALALDDVRPALHAHLVSRLQNPLRGANVDDRELEALRRSELAVGFEVRLLGRHRECLTCHADDASVTDAADPALDRFWPLAAGLDAAVFGDLPAVGPAQDAAFRVSGVLDGPLAPWGIARECVTLSPGRGGNLVDEPGFFAGPLPDDANILDLDARLRVGLAELDDLTTAAEDPPRALAAMIAAHLADGVWTEAAGAPLTLAHGHPRSAAARDALAELTTALVEHDWSLRELVVAAVTHPALDLAAPSACAAELPPLFDPWRPNNHAADLVHRPGPWLLLDGAHEALGWPLAHAFPTPQVYPDEILLSRLGVALAEVEPAARSTDLVAQLAWEARYAPAVDPGLGPPATGPDWISRLLATSPPSDATLADLAITIADRVLAEPDLSRGQADALAALLSAPLATPLAELDDATRERHARALAGALLTTPQFQLHGRPAPHQHGAPRWLTPDSTTRALCESHAALLAPQFDITCSEQAATVTRASKN